MEVNTSNRLCLFCNLNEKDNEDLGRLLHRGTITVHQNCLYFTTTLYQNEDTKKGLMGFVEKDIRAELARGLSKNCSFCGKKGAFVGCARCNRAGHVPCAMEHNFLFQFFDEFKVFCPTHRPQQFFIPPTDSSAPYSCPICLSDIPSPPCPTLPFNILSTPCCNRLCHRACIQRQARSAGEHYFRCPICNNQDQFNTEMRLMGIEIPSRDASWELSNQFQDLHNPLVRCNLPTCSNGRGRIHYSNNNKIIDCVWCGQCIGHLNCIRPYLIDPDIVMTTGAGSSKGYVCSDCIPVYNTASTSSLKGKKGGSSVSTKNYVDMTPIKRKAGVIKCNVTPCACVYGREYNSAGGPYGLVQCSGCQVILGHSECVEMSLGKVISINKGKEYFCEGCGQDEENLNEMDSASDGVCDEGEESVSEGEESVSEGEELTNGEDVESRTIGPLRITNSEPSESSGNEDNDYVPEIPLTISKKGKGRDKDGNGSSSLEPKADQPIQKKRGRGRPRKERPPEQPGQIKRGRGRPRKERPPQDESKQSPKKRRRGRTKKERCSCCKKIVEGNASSSLPPASAALPPTSAGYFAFVTNVTDAGGGWYMFQGWYHKGSRDKEGNRSEKEGNRSEKEGNRLEKEASTANGDQGSQTTDKELPLAKSCEPKDGQKGHRSEKEGSTVNGDQGSQTKGCEYDDDEMSEDLSNDEDANSDTSYRPPTDDFSEVEEEPEKQDDVAKDSREVEPHPPVQPTAPPMMHPMVSGTYQENIQYMVQMANYNSLLFPTLPMYPVLPSTGSNRDTPTASNTDTPTVHNIDIPSSSIRDTPTASNKDTPTASNTDMPTSSNRDIPSSSNRDTPTASNKDTPTASNTDMPTSSNIDIPSSSIRDTPTASNKDTPTASNTDMPTSSNRDIPSSSNRDTPTASNKDTPTASNTDMPTSSNRDIPSSSIRDTPTASNRDTPTAINKDTPTSSSSGNSTQPSVGQSPNAVPYGYPVGFTPGLQVAYPYQQLAAAVHPSAGFYGYTPPAFVTTIYPNDGLMKIPTIRTNRPYIKKPPNSFLLFVKEKREEGVGKDLSAKRSHVIFGKMWKKLSDEEKAKYHKMAHLERVNHKQNYPDWSHSENYGIHKRRKRKYVKKDGLTEKTKNKSSSSAKL